MYPGISAAWRQAMRRHQELPEYGHRLSLSRLVGGELIWAGRQLVVHPGVVAGWLGGSAATFGVLSTTAPGPILGGPWRMLTAVTAGLVIAAGIRGLSLSTARRRDDGARRRDGTHPVTGVAVISGALAVAILLAWLIVWLVVHIR